MVRKILTNPCAKSRKSGDPYEVWIGPNGWEWHVLKKYQAPETEAENQSARWFCEVFSPMCPDGELGDVYVKEIKRAAIRDGCRGRAPGVEK